MPSIYSKRKGAEPVPAGAVYVGRGTPWGNPFVMCRESDREWACSEFDVWATAKAAAEPRWLEALRGKDLVCWCQSPRDAVKKRCHAETLIRLANAMPRSCPSDPNNGGSS